ncbi:hypothetical protein DL96DRAFT_1669795 [Flagelloscypha sp. PMI_526]|nr:hypothetical protein DL96DRAFT_1669795 [Flagelloscypha sp. PMI_526]
MEDDEETTQAIPPHMASLAGPTSHLYFTHLSQKSCDSLNKSLISSPDRAVSRCTSKSVLDLMKDLEQVCLLDPKAQLPLSPEDGDGRFKCFLFGVNIPGDDPPRDRTSELRSLGFPSRHLGSVQMTTDTALGVTKLTEIQYIDFPTIRFSAKESVEMPFRYIMNAHGEPILPPGMKEHLKEDLNKSFDF